MRDRRRASQCAEGVLRSAVAEVAHCGKGEEEGRVRLVLREELERSPPAVQNFPTSFLGCRAGRVATSGFGAEDGGGRGAK
eukprot:7293878-Prymnesium_polylepis.1